MTSITGLPKVLVELIAEFAPKEDAFIGVDPEIVNWYVSLTADYVGRCTRWERPMDTPLCRCSDCICRWDKIAAEWEEWEEYASQYPVPIDEDY
jgi:hypothetical protein